MKRLLWLLLCSVAWVCALGQTSGESPGGLLVEHQQDSARSILLPEGTPMRAWTSDGRRQQGRITRLDSDTVVLAGKYPVRIDAIVRMKAYSTEIGQIQGLAYGRGGLKTAAIGVGIVLLGLLAFLALPGILLIGALITTYGAGLVVIGVGFWLVGTYNRVNLTPLGKSFNIGQAWRLRAKLPTKQR